MLKIATADAVKAMTTFAKKEAHTLNTNTILYQDVRMNGQKCMSPFIVTCKVTFRA